MIYVRNKILRRHALTEEQRGGVMWPDVMQCLLSNCFIPFKPQQFAYAIINNTSIQSHAKQEAALSYFLFHFC